MRSCLIGMRLAQELELDSATRSHLFYALLLKDAGCSANSARMAALFGADDQAKRTSKRVDWARPFPAFVWALRTVAPARLAGARVDRLLAIKDEGEVTRALMQARCDRGAEIALMLGFEAETAEAIRALDEHWDGQASRAGCAARRSRCSGGSCASRRRRRSSTPPAARRGLQDGREAQRRMVRSGARRGAAGGPRRRAFWRSLAEDDVVGVGARRSPADGRRGALDGIAYAFAGVIDAKSPWTYRHSDRPR